MFRTEANSVSSPAAQFVADFNNALKQLTFNSRPIILALTDLARENRAFAREVVDTIETHIRSCPSQMKLPAVYVLDSICKNVGNEYISLAERNLFTTVTSVFDTVDDQTRSSILHLLRTWTETKLFPPTTLDRINIRLRNIMQKSGRVVQAQSSRDLMPNAPGNPLTMPMQPGAPGIVLQPNMIQQGYAHLAQAGISNPLAATPSSVAAVTATALADLDASELPILSRLYQILTNSNAPPPMSPQDLLGQRAAILGHVQAALAQNRLPTTEAVGLIQQLQQLHSIRAMLQQSVAPKPVPAPIAPVAPAPPAPHVGLFSMPGRPQPAPAAPVVAVPPAAANPLSQLLSGPGSNSLFQSLQSALQGASARPMQPSMPAPIPQPSKAAPPTHLATTGRPDFRDPESLKKPYANVISALYDDFKHRCSQCGLRFQEKAKLDSHLDWHFQQKRKEKAGAKKAFSRSWFVAANDWQQSRGGLISLVNQKPDGEKGKSDEESSSDEKKPTTVPSDETQPNCAGCGEPFEQFYDGENEEWMFNNAIRAPDGKIYHPQCYTPQNEEESARGGRKRAHEEITPATSSSSTDAALNGDEASKKPRLS